jgi:hypothetical protein
MESRKQVTLGEVEADSGLLMLVDPGYLQDPNQLQSLLKQIEEFVYRTTEQVGEPKAQLSYENGRPGLGVVFFTPHSKSFYKVVAELDGETLREIRIRFE